MRRVPALRGRIVRIGGVPVETAPVAEEAAWAVRGDRDLTYAAGRRDDAKIVAGAWWPADYSGPPLISLDAGLAQASGSASAIRSRSMSWGGTSRSASLPY